MNKYIKGFIAASALLGNNAFSQNSYIAKNSDRKECAFVFQAPLAADTAIGEISLVKSNLAIDTNHDLFDHNFKMKTCRDSKNWHCISAPGYELYIPRPYRKSLTEWHHGNYSYKFLETGSVTISTNEIKYKPLVVYIKNGNDVRITETYLFDEDMNMIGIIDYIALDSDSQGGLKMLPYNYWLIGKVAPLSCY